LREEGKEVVWGRLAGKGEEAKEVAMWCTLAMWCTVVVRLAMGMVPMLLVSLL